MLAVHHICKTFLPLKGGVEVVVDSMCKATKSDVDSTVISTKRNQLDEVYEFANLKLSRSYLELFSLPVAPSILFEVWRSFKVTDVLCIHAPFPLADLGVSLFGFFYRKKRVVVYWHAQIYSQKLLKFFVLPFSYLMLLRADQIAVASPPMLENSGLLKRFKHKVIVLPYSLSQADHHQTGFNDEGDFFLAIGRHVAYKGFDVLIKAMASTGEKLIIVGDGISYNDNLRLVEELELENKVVLLKNVSNTEKEKLLSSCKALVLSSIFPSEAFALVQLEAMKFRKPIINTDLNTGVPWVARHEKEALTVKSRSIDDLAEAITKLSLSETLRKELGSNGVKRLSVVFGFEKFKQGVLKFLSI